MADHFDAVIVGQGLAGTAVAWQLRFRGRRVLVVDRDEPDTASRAAAGLLTPVTGGRFAPTPDFLRLRAAAVQFYRRVEQAVGESLLDESGAVRLFADAADRAAFDLRADRLAGLAAPLDHPPPADCFHAPAGGFAMPLAARLRAEHYLTASRRVFASDGGYVVTDLDPAGDVEVSPAGVRLPGLGVTAGAVVFCQGWAAADNPHLAGLSLAPVAGELLTVRLRDTGERRTVHGPVWLAPAGDIIHRAGATYARGRADPTPTAAGRAEVLARLGAFLKVPVEAVAHRAGVRAVAPGHRPLIGWLPHAPRVGFLVGLGSKGALTAPAAAAALADGLPR